ncbi:MAG: D-2-hydroxyacid dehydrogenase [Oscillospiraceae bacterium]|nr:D-2-hydroxyacid dehydrogenase [Oscillospiraceae bacterium]
MKKKLLVIMMPFSPEYRAALDARAKDMEIAYCEREAPTDEQLRLASIIMGNPPPKRLRLCERLEWLQLQTAGFDAYSAPSVMPEGAALCSCSGAYGLTISEYMVGTTLSVMKKLPIYRDQQRSHVWANAGPVRIVARSSVLVVGFGDIGSQYARKMAALSANVSAIRRVATDKPDYLEAVYSTDRMDDVLPNFDIVALCLPNNAETAGMFNRARIERMKRGAILLNIGRGAAVETDALCDALESGALGAAALDVTDPEPLPPEHRLWNIGSALITPHAAGGHEFGEIYPSIIGIWLDNLRRYLAGEPLINLIDIRTGHRAGR